MDFLQLKNKNIVVAGVANRRSVATAVAKILQETGGADFAHIVKVDELVWRFRVNILNQMGRLGLVARKVNNSIPVFEKLFLPQVLEELCKYSQGMVLLAGITGSGKSTTIASMLDWINHRYKKHILTLEDPIEFTFTEDKCLINQREIGQDVCDFMTGMKHAVREDPDIILVGEMRDRETFETAIHAAETGHLVFGTIHASTAPSTIWRSTSRGLSLKSCCRPLKKAYSAFRPVKS